MKFRGIAKTTAAIALMSALVASAGMYSTIHDSYKDKVGKKERKVEVPVRQQGKTQKADDEKTEKPREIIVTDTMKVAYLTFDDGPDGIITPKILDFLKANNIKATFFLLGSSAEKYPEITKRISEEGHSIGNHTYSHRYDFIYSSWNALKNEVLKTNSILKSLTGVDVKLFRAPGGSVPFMKDEYINGIHAMGMKVFDWNSDTQDSLTPKKTKEDILKNVYSEAVYNHMFVLMHSRYDNQNTYDALESIVKFYKDKGYTFLPITDSTVEKHY